jgi:hypothetical protein
MSFVERTNLFLNVRSMELLQSRRLSVRTFFIGTSTNALTSRVADIFADLVLVASSIRLFTASQGLSRRQRQRLTGVFCACLATTVASMVHAYYVLRVPGGFDVILFASVEVRTPLV